MTFRIDSTRPTTTAQLERRGAGVELRRPGRGRPRRRRRRRRSGVQAARDPRRRRRVAAVRRGGDDPQLGGRPREVGAGRARRPELDDRRGRLRPHHRRPGHAVVPGEGLRRLLAQAPVARLERRRDRQLRHLRALPASRRRRSRGPRAERYPCQVGSATSQPAWVAIFCGHEIQINDDSDLRAPEDRLDLQLLAAQRDAGEGPAEGHVGRLRGPRRRPDVHDHPQRRGAPGRSRTRPTSRPRGRATRRPTTASSRAATSASRTTAAAT